MKDGKERKKNLEPGIDKLQTCAQHNKRNSQNGKSIYMLNTKAAGQKDGGGKHFHYPGLSLYLDGPAHYDFIVSIIFYCFNHVILTLDYSNTSVSKQTKIIGYRNILSYNSMMYSMQLYFYFLASVL
jgi:hypothetical protein